MSPTSVTALKIVSSPYIFTNGHYLLILSGYTAVYEYVQGGFACGLASPARVMLKMLAALWQSKNGDETKCQELNLLCKLQQRMRHCSSFADTCSWPRNIRHTYHMTAASSHYCTAAAVLLMLSLEAGSANVVARRWVACSRDAQNVGNLVAKDVGLEESKL